MKDPAKRGYALLYLLFTFLEWQHFTVTIAVTVRYGFTCVAPPHVHSVAFFTRSDGRNWPAWVEMLRLTPPDTTGHRDS